MSLIDNVKYTNLSASIAIKSSRGAVHGFVVNSHTSGTLKLWDNTSAAGTVIIETFTFPAGSGVYMLGPGISFNTGLFATIGGTANITILWE